MSDIKIKLSLEFKISESDLEDGLAEAKRTNRPIFFMAVASQCGGVPGVF